MKRILLSVAVIAMTGIVSFAQNTTTPPPPPPAPTPARDVAAPPPPDRHAQPTPTPAAVPVVDDKTAPDIVFESETIDYGTIPHFADGQREFKFKNKGKSPLIITNCQGSCGCTVPTWPKEAIKPGKSGVIYVKYATDRVGPFEKSVTVTSNAKTATKVLKIKGNVLAEPATKPADGTEEAPKDDHAGHNH
ncbi:MAG: DUF1573 domain-containing protein [Chitinophagaceae bacterium]|nr:DUF1573 domain-containing protein [Chitinophagaceae bacterium]